MATDIEQIVNVTISRQTTAVTQAGFGVMMFLGKHKVFNELSRSYPDSASLITDGFNSTDKEYIAASEYFSQDIAPTSILIGRQETDDLQTLTFGAASAGGEVYTLVAKSGIDAEETFIYTSSGAETAAVVASGMTLLVNASGTLALTMDDTAVDGTATITTDVATVPYTLKLTGAITVALSTTQTFTDAVTAVNEDGAFYGLSSYSHVAATITELSVWANANKKIYGYSTADAATKLTTVTDTMATLQASSYDRSFGLFGGNAGVDEADATEYPESAWMGNRFPTPPGSSTWMFKTLNGITVDKMSTIESTNIRDKNGNTYETIGGVNITREGKMASGEYIDVIRGVDWLESRMEERIYGRLVNLEKIPYTNAGIAIIENEIRAQLQEGIAAGVLDGERGYTVTVPRISEISANDRANRILPDIKFEAFLAGAIHRTTILGSVSI